MKGNEMKKFYKIPNLLFKYALKPSAFALYLYLSRFPKMTMRVKFSTLAGDFSHNNYTLISLRARLVLVWLLNKLAPRKKSVAQRKFSARFVAEIDSGGEVVEFYSSARSCAKANYMSHSKLTQNNPRRQAQNHISQSFCARQLVVFKLNLLYPTVMDRCNGRCKKAFAPDGCEYAWEDNAASLAGAYARIEKKNREMSETAVGTAV